MEENIKRYLARLYSEGWEEVGSRENVSPRSNRGRHDDSPRDTPPESREVTPRETQRETTPLRRRPDHPS